MSIALNLQLFADGGESASAVGTETEGVKPAPTGTESVNSQSSPDTDRQAQYSKFKEDYKDEYNAEVQSIVKDRLKKSNAQNAELNKRLGSIAPIMEHLAKQYGVETDDYEAIVNAFNDDDSIYEDEAYEKGMTTEQVKQFHIIERENQSLRQAEEERRRQAQYAEWDRQAEATKRVYPDFDMQSELENNPQFRRMLNAGVDAQTAYEVAHKDEIVRGAMQFSVQKANEKLTNAVASNKARPSENGLSSSAPALVKVDISRLDKNQIADIKRRAAAGEIITFK